MANDSVLSYIPEELPECATAQAHFRTTMPIHHQRHLKVICIGAGASGLLMAYKMQRNFENYELMCYEKNDDISGTWYENRYPGCACDIAAHIYTWSFEPNPSWSSVYAGSEEIHNYFCRFSKKYNLSKFYKLRHLVTSCIWDDTRGGWDVEVTNLNDGSKFTDQCDILINGAGVLNTWKWPEIQGLHNFKGNLMHTANWDKSADLKGKNVGLIGNGSSAIQVLPNILPDAKRVTTFFRGPTWVSPVKNVVMDQHFYTDEERHLWEGDAQEHLKYRKKLENSLNKVFPMFLLKSERQQDLRVGMTEIMKGIIKNEELEKKLIPSWAVGCRRMTPGVGYLEALVSDKVDISYGTVQQVTEGGVIGGDGKEYPLDVLICATGFDTSYLPRFSVIGANGVSMREAWAKEPRSYMGVGTNGFPNYMMITGPNSPIGNGAVLVGMEAQADYICKMMDRWQTESIHSFSPKAEAVDEFLAHKDAFMKGTVWQQECRSWYKSNSITGKVTALWPGSSLHYLEAMKEPRYEDWDIKYSGNRFSFLGNGYSQTEVDPTADRGWYLRNEDDGEYLSRGKRRKVFSKAGTWTLDGPVEPKNSQQMSEAVAIKVRPSRHSFEAVNTLYELLRFF
uniref:Uncharacterized protein n=1 Tax=Psilocybe cubensis TaxID=181762 RepID=A0A8H7Y6L6_PSICU